MPYRRLPTTDAARLRALKIPYDKVQKSGTQNMPFSIETFRVLQNLLSRFEQYYNQQKNTIIQKNNKSKQLAQYFLKARLYVVHYLKVINMAIERGDLPQNIRTFYGLDAESMNLPVINNEKDLEYWGNKVIKGEQERLAKTGRTFYILPTIAMVKLHFDKFLDAYNQYLASRKTSDYIASKINELRNDVDKFIVHLWNETEAYFKDYSEEEKRRFASEYGIVYVWRPSEKTTSYNNEIATEKELLEVINQAQTSKKECELDNNVMYSISAKN
ncbi:MAG: hypothetical protein N3A01_04220 [Bacteroidales bacterium]|nr:hypothetical protein [Bacteroidales bacterium]